jgi:2-oxoisovalerate ferredoxin oxidoreductase alpha subunit
VAYGTSSRIARTAAEALRADGVKAGVFRPVTLNPFPDAGLSEALKGRRALVVELSAGQFYDDVILHLAKAGGPCPSVALCNRMGGMVMTVDDVVAAAKGLGK